MTSHPRWSRLWHLPGAPKMQIALARCDTSTITVHKGIPIFVLRKKKQWHDSLTPDIQLVPRGIPLSSTADFCCLKLQTAGVVMVFTWVFSQCFLCLCRSPGQPDLGGEIGLNWAGGRETILQARATAIPIIYSVDSLLQAWALGLSLNPEEALSHIWIVSLFCHWTSTC